MSIKQLFGKYKQQWIEMDPKFKYAIGAIIVGGTVLTFVQSKQHAQIERQIEEDKAAKAAQATANTISRPGIGNNGMTMSAIPTTNRNQGLEDLLASLAKTSADAKDSAEASKAATAMVSKINERLSQLENGRASGQVAAAPTNGSGLAGTSFGQADHADINASLPPPVDFSQPGGKQPIEADKGGINAGISPEADVKKSKKNILKEWDESADNSKARAVKSSPGPVISIPVNAALESVMLSGINARSNSSGGAANGAILSANNVGSPFVTRIKGQAILPNGWRVGDFEDCFISGTGIAVLSSERANVISNRISCIDKKGNIYESAIKAYGLDLDGIQGITGRVVTKQGAILAKTALAGLAAGLGTAVSPSAVPGYNSNQQSGDKQGIQYPNLALVGQSALGTGISDTSRQLSKFYLDYAKEMFPVIEVNAGTRITWILQETVELTRPEK